MLTPEFKKRLDWINNMSSGISTDSQILSMMGEHVSEIKKRFADKDDHWTIETFDLIVLSLQLLSRKGYNIGEVAEKALPRFYKKLPLMKNAKLNA